MREEILRRRLLKDKALLYKLYEGDQTGIKKLITSATDAEIITILHYLNKLCNGRVVFRKVDFEKILAHKKLLILRKGVEKKSDLRRKIRDKSDARIYLVSISKVIPILLRPIFEQNE